MRVNYGASNLVTYTPMEEVTTKVYVTLVVLDLASPFSSEWVWSCLEKNHVQNLMHGHIGKYLIGDLSEVDNFQSQQVCTYEESCTRAQENEMTYLEFNTRTGFNVGDALHSIRAKHARESERKWNLEICENNWRRRRERLEAYAVVFMFMTLFQPIQTLSIVFSDFVFDPDNDSLAFISFFIGIVIHVMLLKIGFVLKSCIRSENRNFISGL